MEDAEARFAALQARLTPLLAGPAVAERPVVVVPSYSLDAELLAAHATQLPVLEERFLFALFLLRARRFRVLFVTRSPLPDGVLEYYLGLMPGVATGGRLEIVVTGDERPRPLACTLLERPDLVERIRAWVGDTEPAAMIVFSAREPERDLALALDVSLYAPDHRFVRYGLKTGGRRLFAEAGVAHPRGVEGVRTAADVAAAMERIGANAVVVKHDDSVYGEGNVILRGDADPRTLPAAYLRTLAAQGGIVEELVEGEEVRSPSVQMRIIPHERPAIISTHDQILGGAGGQQFVGCRFPADPAYAGLVSREAEKVARHLQERGVIGRFGVDFVVARRGEEWEPYAVEINLREGGTSHPIGSLWLLTDGQYDPSTGFTIPGGGTRSYVAADMVGDAGWAGLPVRTATAAVRAAGLEWDPERRKGAVLHMLRGLQVDGRISITAVGESAAEADAIYAGTLDAISRA